MSIICNHGFKSSGTVLIDGADPAENSRILGETCFIHENQRWHDAYTAGMIPRSAQRFYPRWDTALSDRLTQRFELPLSTRANKLSRGQRSAMAIVIALSSHAKYTFLDEPYLGMDPTARAIFYEELAVTQAHDPRTFIMSTHLIDECSGLLETVTILDHGRLVIADDVDHAISSTGRFTGTKEQAEHSLKGMNILSTSSMGPISSIIFTGSLDEDRLAALRTSGAMEIDHATLQELVSAIGAIEPQTTTQGTSK